MNSKTYENFQVATDDRGVMTVTLDVPNRPLNVLDQNVMIELDQIVGELESNQGVRAVVIQSGKESGFLAGADVKAIADVKSDLHAGELISGGQKLFARIEALPMPTIVVIHGPCLGGGLELSLSCNHRIARDNSSTQIGLPEIKLGVIPGWGGTQRLPRLVGLSTALDMILKGTFLNARKALRVGLIDRAIDPKHWDDEVASFVDDVLADKQVTGKSRLPLWQRLMDKTRLGRMMVFRATRKAVAKRTDHYPALESAIKAVAMGYDPKADGYQCEKTEFVRLLSTPTSRNLLGLFFSREKARSLKTWAQDAQAAHDVPISKVGVVGAGAMGAGIGQLAAFRGFDVAMKEINQEAADAGRKRIEGLFAGVAKRKGWDDQQLAEMNGKVEISCDDASLADADLVIEAVVERMDVKQSVFKTLDAVVQPSAILSSNTSSLSVSEMAEATNRAGSVAGLHFFNPVHRMELVEVVRGKETNDACIARLVGFVRALGKTPIVTADAPGFLVNRVLFPYLGEAVLMVGESHDVASIDRQVRRFGMPMGPLELLDQVGIDVAHHVASSLDKILPGVGRVVEQLGVMVDHGYLGKKTGRGFYHYQNDKKGDVAQLPHVTAGSIPTTLENDFNDDGLTAVQRRLVYPMLAEAIRCHEEHIVDQPWAIDLGMVLGTGFAPHRGGPLHVVDEIGQETVLENFRRLQKLFGKRFEPPKQLIEMSEQGEKFFGRNDTAATSHAASS